MKRLLAIGLVLLLLYNHIGFYLVFRIEQYNVRQEVKLLIKRSIPEEELVRIILTSEEEKKLYWTRPGKEFFYRNCMYDVVRENRTKTGTCYYCIPDFKETGLFAGLDKYIDRSMKENPRESKTISFLKKLHLNYITENKPGEYSGFQKAGIDFPEKMEFYIFFQPAPPSPPPNIA